ncbi:hypothetical protein Csa_023536, partial [Cucumis sativus]
MLGTDQERPQPVHARDGKVCSDGAHTEASIVVSMKFFFVVSGESGSVRKAKEYRLVVEGGRTDDNLFGLQWSQLLSSLT